MRRQSTAEQREEKRRSEPQVRQSLSRLGLHGGGAFCDSHPSRSKTLLRTQRRQRHALLAVKALAHKLARACFYVLRAQVPFAPERLFV
jgi:hypothetical protein